MAELARIIAPSAAELEAFKAAAQRIGHTARAIECNMVEAFAAAGRAALSAAHAWRMAAGRAASSPRTDPTIGRKRRARRARGRRIEARQALGHGHWFRVKLDSASGFRSKPIGPTTRIFNVDIPTCIDEVDSFLDPSLGEPWEEQAHEADQDPR
jgi:hypothetical protein